MISDNFVGVVKFWKLSFIVIFFFKIGILIGVGVVFSIWRWRSGVVVFILKK